jgi:glycosyltransferase involved in cell wall biosynthesis
LAPASQRTRFDVPPALDLVRRLADGRRTILFAGPLDDESGIEQLVTGFAFLLSFGIDARLTIVGSFDRDDSIGERFFAMVASAGLGDRVLVFETNDPSVAAAAYRSADLFWSMAQHGPAREIIDALGYGVPVFAFGNDASRSALDTSGLLFWDQSDFRALAGVAALLLTDRTLRATILDGQRRRFETLCREDRYSIAS